MLQRSDLHDYQKRVIDFICEKMRCAVYLDMGLGKTVSTLTAMSDLLDAHIVSRVLVIAPLQVCNNVWRTEHLKWEHLRHLKISVCTGAEKRRVECLKTKANIYVVNRENVPWLIEWLKGKWPFDALVIDESSSFKNPSSKRFKFLKRVCTIPSVVVLLSGTPAPNSLLDLWPQYYLIDQGRSLGRTITAYRNKYFNPDYWGYTWSPKIGADDEIKDIIRNITLSMQAKDYLELPDIVSIVEEIHLDDTVMNKYKQFQKELIVNLPLFKRGNTEGERGGEERGGEEQYEDGEEIIAVNAAVLAGKLLQWTSGACYTDEAGSYEVVHDSKLDALEELVESNQGERILVAYNFKSDLDRLKKRFPKAVVLDSKSNETIEKWNRGEISLLLAHPASCGHGLNLQYGGNVLAWFSLVWSLEQYLQMNARLHRQGAERPVRVVHLVASGTIDERVMAVLIEKDHVQSRLVEALKDEFKGVLQ